MIILHTIKHMNIEGTAIVASERPAGHRGCSACVFIMTQLCPQCLNIGPERHSVIFIEPERAARARVTGELK